MGWLNTPRAFVIVIPRARAAGVSTRSTPALAECTHAQARRAGEQAVEGVGREPAAEQHLDVVERLVGQPLARELDQARAGRSRADPLEVGRSVARREDRRERDGRRDAAGIRGRAAAVIAGAQLAPACTRATQRSGRVQLLLGRQRLGPLPQPAERGRPAAPRDARDEPLAAAVLLELEVEAGQPQDRALDGLRRSRRSWNRALIRSTSGTSSRPTSSMT